MSKINDERGKFFLFASGPNDETREADLFNYSEAINAAREWSERLGVDWYVCLAEWGRFRSNNKSRVGFLDIWWPDNQSEETGREPKARGYGFYSPEVGRKRWVEYEPILDVGPPDELYDDADLARTFSPAGAFSVWHHRSDEEINSEEFSNYDAALKRANELSLQAEMLVSLWEYGSYALNGETENGLVRFWWNEHEGKIYDAAKPVGRGIALVTEKDVAPALVAYEPEVSSVEPEDIDEEEDNDEEAIVDDEVSGGNYVKTSCEDCGLIMPLYEKHEYSYEEEVGRSSGSARVGRSARRRTSSTGRSAYSTGSSSSYSTGRTYYATRTLVLCEDCFGSRIAADEEEDREFWAIVKKVAAAVAVVALALAMYLALGR
jgi:hypothetical protein